MSKEKSIYYETDIGTFLISFDSELLLGVKYFEATDENKTSLKQLTGIALTTAQQIDEFIKGKRKYFDLPIAPANTEFQEKVRNAVLKVAYGQTSSYKEVAKAIGSPKASRAIGLAHSKNPLQLIIPFHRIVKTNLQNGKILFQDNLQKSLLIIENVVNI